MMSASQRTPATHAAHADFPLCKVENQPLPKRRPSRAEVMRPWHRVFRTCTSPKGRWKQLDSSCLLIGQFCSDLEEPRWPGGQAPYRICVSRVLYKFVLEEELPDLPAPDIQARLRKLETCPSTLPGLLAPAALSPPVENDDGLVHPAPSLPAGNGVAVAPTDLSGVNEVMELDEHPQRQEVLACMVLNSWGNIVC